MAQARIKINESIALVLSKLRIPVQFRFNSGMLGRVEPSIAPKTVLLVTGGTIPTGLILNLFGQGDKIVRKPLYVGKRPEQPRYTSYIPRIAEPIPQCDDTFVMQVLNIVDQVGEKSPRKWVVAQAIQTLPDRSYLMVSHVELALQKLTDAGHVQTYAAAQALANKATEQKKHREILYSTTPQGKALLDTWKKAQASAPVAPQPTPTFTNAAAGATP